MVEHPSYRHWHAAICRLVPHAVAFTGLLYRASDPRYANTRDLLTGEGARKSGGRWNAPGAFPLVYLSQSVEAAFAETLGLSAHYGFDPAARLPLTVVALHVTLQRVLDVTDPSVRKSLALTLIDCNGCPWRTENAAGRETFTQALGRAAFHAGLQGIVVSSPLKRSFRHLNVFPRNLDTPARLKILGADRLPPPFGSGLI